MIAPPRNVLGREFIANNTDLLADLMRRGSRTCDAGDLWFPAGSMFWSRPEVLLPLQDLHLGPQDFGEETGAIDGTLPHALERYLGVVAASEGLAVVESSEVERLLADRVV